MQLCDYGCGQEAKFPFKNGKWCCSERWELCKGSRNRSRKKSIEQWKNPESIKKASESAIKRFKKNSEKEKQSQRMKDRFIKDPTIKIRIGKANKKRFEDPNERRRLGEKIKAGLSSIEVRDKMSISQKKRFQKKEERIKCASYGMKGKTLSEEHKKKIGEANSFTLKDYKEKRPFFFKVEELRETKDGEIQAHCKNHNCKNSKEKGGWFTPTKNQLYERVGALENPRGFGESNFYCCQECKNECPLYGNKNDPFKNIHPLPYTAAEKQLWIQIVLKLDKGLCQYCGKPATDVHHIKPVKTHPYLALDPNNGISFCEECHYKIGHKTGSECSTGNLANKQGCVLGGQ